MSKKINFEKEEEKREYEEQVRLYINDTKRALMEFGNDMDKLNDENKLYKFEDLMDNLKQKFDNIIKDVTKDKIGDILEKEKKTNVKCPCCKNVVKITKKNCKYTILTKYGEIPFERDYFYCRNCRNSSTLLDNKLVLFGDHKVTLRMTEIITYAGQIGLSFEGAAEIINKFTGIEISVSLLRLITEGVGDLVFKKDMEEANKTYVHPEVAIPSIPEKDKKEGRLYLMADGSFLNTIHKDDKGKTWKEIKLGLVFVDSNNSKKYGNIEKEYVTFFGEASEFKKLLFDAAIRNGYGVIKEIIFVGDGAKWIWNMCAELFPDAKLVLDYFHLKKNISIYSKYLYPKNEIGAKRWSKEMLDKVYEGNIAEVIQGLPILDKDDLPDGVPNLRVYLENNKNRVDYKKYKEEGYYIGSGAIEGGNKSVIQKRMKGSGMRWSKIGGQQIASLRAKYSSNKWDEVLSAIGF